jgi:hypothetical protein
MKMDFNEASLADRNQLISLLTENTCVVKFTKVDGELREMPCTLRPDLLPPITESKDKKEKKPNDSVLSVWCTDKESWRSFRVDSVQSIEVQ